MIVGRMYDELLEKTCLGRRDVIERELEMR